MTKFIERLKELRKEKKLNQTQFAKAIKVSQSTVAKWENGERTPNIDFLFLICKEMGVSADYLIGLTDF